MAIKNFKDLDPNKVKESIQRFGLDRTRGAIQQAGLGTEKARGFKEGQVVIPGVNTVLPPMRSANKENPIVSTGTVDTSLFPTEAGDKAAGIGSVTETPTTEKETVVSQDGVVTEQDRASAGTKGQVTGIAEQIVQGEFGNLGLPSSKLHDNNAISKFLKSQFNFDDATIQNIIDQKDSTIEGGREIKRIQDQAAQMTSSTEDLFAQQLQQREAEIQAQGKKVMDTTQRLNSLRGAGRSTANEKSIQEQQSKISGLIAAAQKDSHDKLLLRKMEIEGAEAESIAAVREGIQKNEKILKERIDEAAVIQKQLDLEIGADAATSAENIKGILEAGGEDTTGIDLGVTNKSGENYFLKSNGDIWLDSKGNPMVYKKNEFGMDTKISNFKDANDNTYVYENGILNRIITNAGDVLTGEQLNTVKVPATVEEDKTIKQRRDTESSLRNEFIKRPEVKKFQDVRSQFERVKQGAEADTPAGDLALIFSFMKMLDPASVVREGEFALAENTVGVPDHIRNQYNKVVSGERLGVEQRDQFKKTAEGLFEFETNTFNTVKEGFMRVIEDIGARPDFVLVGESFDTQLVDTKTTFNTEENTQLDDIFGPSDNTPSTGGTFETKSGFKFDFKLPDSTGGTNEIGLNIQKDIDRIAKNSPVKADDIVNIATTRQIDPAILAAFLRNDSSFGTKGLGAKNNNPGNVGQFDRFGTEGVEGFKTIQEGIDAAAKNLQERTLAFNKIIPNRRPTAIELATGKTKEGKKFFGVYMTDPKGPERVQQIVNQLIS